MRRDTGAFSFALAELQSDGLRRGRGIETQLFSNVVPQLVIRRMLKVLQKEQTKHDQGPHLRTSPGVTDHLWTRDRVVKQIWISGAVKVCQYHRSEWAQRPTSFDRQLHNCDTQLLIQYLVAAHVVTGIHNDWFSTFVAFSCIQTWKGSSISYLGIQKKQKQFTSPVSQGTTEHCVEKTMTYRSKYFRV